jgi:hypothetical protein
MILRIHKDNRENKKGVYIFGVRRSESIVSSTMFNTDIIYAQEF